MQYFPCQQRNFAENQNILISSQAIDVAFIQEIKNIYRRQGS